MAHVIDSAGNSPPSQHHPTNTPKPGNSTLKVSKLIHDIRCGVIPASFTVWFIFWMIKVEPIHLSGTEVTSLCSLKSSSFRLCLHGNTIDYSRVSVCEPPPPEPMATPSEPSSSLNSLCLHTILCLALIPNSTASHCMCLHIA